LRIWPAYFVALAIIVLISHPEYLQLSRFPELGLFAAFLMDSTQSTYQQINGPFWTLAVEWQYYMLLPLLALVLRWCVGQGPLRQRWWRLVACLGVMITWGVITRAFGHYCVNLHPDQTFLVPRQVLNGVLFVIYGFNGKFAEDFATGMLISCLYMLAQQQASTNTLRSLPEKTRRYSYWLWGIGVLWLLAMTIWNGNVRFHAIPWLDQLFEPYFWFSELGLSIGFGLCMVALLFGPEALRRPFEWAPLCWLGMISYSLYIWHLPLASDFALHMDGIKDILPHPLSYGMYWLYVALVIVPFSYGFYKLIERPWIRLGDRWLKRKKQDGQGQAVPGPEHEKPCTWINRKK
jgi:peptidoglycan/LPS O-acetylase OafA/YrhL